MNRDFMSQQAKSLNYRIEGANPVLAQLFSKRGKRIYFPYEGILGQGAEAKDVDFNATIGLAREDDGSPMRLSPFAQPGLPPAQVLNYAPSHGQMALRGLWREMIFSKNPTLKGSEISLPVVTQALTHGLSLAAFLFLDEGQEVLLPVPHWDNYSLLFEECHGARIAPFPCFDGQKFNLTGLAECLERRRGQKLFFLFNSPNNPTGYTPDKTELFEIANIFRKSAQDGTKIVLVCDDAYFGLVYEPGVCRESLFSHVADAHENLLAVKLDGVTKEDYAWGLRVGFITFSVKNGSTELYEALADKAAGAIRGLISNCSQLSQSLVLRALRHPAYKAEKQEKFNTLKNRYNILKNELRGHPEYSRYFKPLPCNSGYFMCLEAAEGIDTPRLRRRLIERYSTGVITLGPLIRIAFSCIPGEKIPGLLQNLYQACEEVAVSEA